MASEVHNVASPKLLMLADFYLTAFERLKFASL